MPDNKREMFHALIEPDVFIEMPESMFTKLNDARHYGVVWELIRTHFVPRIVGPGFSTVPCAFAGNFFDIHNIFSKDAQSIGERLCHGKPPTLKYVGNLAELLDHQRGKRNVWPHCLSVDDDTRFTPIEQRVYHLVGRQGNIKKEVHIELRGLRKRRSWLQSLGHDDVFLKEGHTDGKKVYIVNEAFTVDYLKIVTFGGRFSLQGERWEFTDTLPVAFKLLKTVCGQTGRLGNLHTARAKISNKSCDWILPRRPSPGKSEQELK